MRLGFFGGFKLISQFSQRLAESESISLHDTGEFRFDFF